MNANVKNAGAASQTREQMSGADLHVFTVKFLALKKCFFHVFGVKKIKKGIMQLFSADPKIFSKKF